MQIGEIREELCGNIAERSLNGKRSEVGRLGN